MKKKEPAAGILEEEPARLLSDPTALKLAAAEGTAVNFEDCGGQGGWGRCLSNAAFVGPLVLVLSTAQALLPLPGFGKAPSLLPARHFQTSRRGVSPCQLPQQQRCLSGAEQCVGLTKRHLQQCGQTLCYSCVSYLLFL